MDVAPPRRHPAEQVAGRDVIVLAHGREDVPVGEGVPVGLLDRDRVRIEVNDSGCDRIDGCAVGRGDVDAEVERVLGATVQAEALARIVEGAADRMRAIERLERPPVRMRASGREQRCDACRSRRKAHTHPVGTTLGVLVFSSD
jgi:hypothetical protein